MDLTLVVAAVIGLAAAWLLLVALLWVLHPRDARLGDLVRVVPDVVRLCRDVLTDRAAPLSVRIAIGGLLVYLVNPIDLIPEFIPVLEPLDDVVVAVLVLRYFGGKSASRECARAGMARPRASSWCAPSWADRTASGEPGVGVDQTSAPSCGQASRRRWPIPIRPG